MIQRSVFGYFLAISIVFCSTAAFAGKIELTTYYPSPYGEYENLNSAEDSNFATASGNVGIGTTAPQSKLGVSGNASVGATYGDMAAPASGLIVEGNVGIGTTTPTDQLHIRPAGATGGGVKIENDLARVTLGVEANGNSYLELRTCGTAASGNVPYIDFSNDYTIDYDMRIILLNDNNLNIPKGALTQTSDARIKMDQAVIPYGLNEIMKLRPKKYMRAEFKQDLKNGALEVDKSNLRPDIGFVAQEVFEVIPEAASKPEDEKKTGWSLGYDKLTPVLVKAIQEQQKEIEDQQRQIDLLENEVLGLQGQKTAV